MSSSLRNGKQPQQDEYEDQEHDRVGQEIERAAGGHLQDVPVPEIGKPVVVAVGAPDSSGHYRIRQPIEALRAAGELDYWAVDNLPVEFKQGRVCDVHLAPGVEVVVLQRPMLDFMPVVIDILHLKGIAVVIDIDDDFHTVHVNNTAFMLNHPKVSPRQNWHHLGACVRKADLVTVSTDALARRYGSHGRVAVLRNCIDDDWLGFPHYGDGRTVGWAGTVINHPTDLQATRGGVQMALTNHPDWHFLCVGGAKYADRVQRGLELAHEPDATEWRPLELHGMVMSAIDVGIVPLADTAFNHAKSWLKGVEYSALGIPFVASDVPEYQLLKQRYGLGVLAKPRSREWRARLGAIMEQEHLHDAYRDFARDQVRQYLTISRNAWRWQEVWESLRCPAACDASSFKP